MPDEELDVAIRNEYVFAYPQKQRKMPSTPEVEQLRDELKNNIYNNETLQRVIKSSGSGVAMEIIRLVKPRLMVTTCTDCRGICFSPTLKSAYGGSRWVCDPCSKAYVLCHPCDSLILCDDNDIHFHAQDLNRLRRDNEVAAFDADIMRGGGELRGARPVTFRRNLGVPPPAPDRFFGIELELERKLDTVVPPDMILKAKNVLAQGLVMVKHDGSLGAGPNGGRGGNGFEVVTLPCTMNYHRTEAGWHRFFEVMGKWMQEKPVTTGLHVHVSSNTMTRATIGKIIKFINRADNISFLRVVADRDFTAPNPNGRVYANTYPDNVDKKVTELISRRVHAKGCKNSPVERIIRGFYLANGRVFFDDYGHPLIQEINNGTLKNLVCKCPDGKYDYGGHYAAFNVRTNRPTIEFRMFQGSTNEDHFWAALDFSDAIIRFCEATSFSDLSWQNFIAWFKTVRAQYKSLAKWLVVSGYIDPLKKKG